MSLSSRCVRIARALAPELKNLSSVRGHVFCSGRCPRHRPHLENYTSPVLCDTYLRNFSTKPDEASEPAPSEQGDASLQSSADGDADDSTADAAAAAPEGSKEADLEKQIKDLKDNLLRSLAEQENTRRIAQRDVANAKSFAISSFAKGLLDTSDNLSRALDAVPEDLRHDHENHPVLANLYEGISMTDEGLTKAFAKNGLIKFGTKGEKFDPNFHEALFEYPDPEGEAGNIGQVMKVGFMLNNRVVRPAEVGVVKAP